MKRMLALLLCGAVLLLAACGAREEEAEKDHYYEISDHDGAVLYTVTDGEMLDLLDDLLGTPAEDMEHAGDTEDLEVMYTYSYWQEKTLLAGEDPETDREYEELMRIQVPAEGETLVIQVLPNADALEGLNWLTRETVDIGELLTSTMTVSPETAEALRAPESFIK